MVVNSLNVALSELHRKELKGAIVDDIARFKLYRAAMAGNEFALLVSKVGANETPANCAKISALASYTMISPDENPTIAVYSGEFKDGAFQGLNDFDGNVRIEIWRYHAMDMESGTVDRLSLFLSLEDNEDPRVEKENKSMFDKIWQKM